MKDYLVGKFMLVSKKPYLSQTQLGNGGFKELYVICITPS